MRVAEEEQFFTQSLSTSFHAWRGLKFGKEMGYVGFWEYGVGTVIKRKRLGDYGARGIEGLRGGGTCLKFQRPLADLLCVRLLDQRNKKQNQKLNMSGYLIWR